MRSGHDLGDVGTSEKMLKRCSRGEQCVNLNGPTLPLSEFHANRSTQDGLQFQCKVCLRSAIRRYQTSEQGREKQRYFRQNWYQKYGKEPEIRQRQRIHEKKYQKTHTRPSRPHRKYKKLDSAQRRIYKHRRAARVRALPSTLTRSEWDQTLAYYDHRCAYCGGLDPRGLVQEHVIPVTQDGGYTRENIVPACWKCNSKKRDRTPEQAGLLLRKPILK